jgi:hypothetical protein
LAFLSEKRGKIHEVPVHSKAREAIDQWLLASGLGSNPSAPLFPAFGKSKKTPELSHMDRTTFGSSCRPEPTPADSTNEYVVMPSDRQA